MKHLRLALIFSSFAICAVHAQRGGEPDPIPDFSNLDEFIYTPKTTLSIGVRSMNGAKTSFRGQGLIGAPENPGNATDANISRTYHDGAVQPDARHTTVDNGDGTTTDIPIASDGKTDTWNFTSDKQATQFPGYIAQHVYSAAVTDTDTHSNDGKGSIGMELAVSREMGNIFHTRLQWSLTAGITVNDISAKLSTKVRADLTTVTDLYSLYGETAPVAPYGAPSTSTVNIVDAGGNPLLNPDGTNQTLSTDTTVPISNAPVNRTTTTTTDTASVTNNFKLKGAYFTFRAGPTLMVPITSRLRANISVGATLIYAGSNYSVNQSYQPDTGIEIDDTESNDTSRLIPGYYADATLQFDLTPRAGLYAGAVFQNAGDYNQSIKTATANYSTKLEFGNQQGFRAGMTIKF